VKGLLNKGRGKPEPKGTTVILVHGGLEKDPTSRSRQTFSKSEKPLEGGETLLGWGGLAPSVREASLA